MRKYQKKRREEIKSWKREIAKATPVEMREPAYIAEEKKQAREVEEHKKYIEELKKQEQEMQVRNKIKWDFDTYYNLV